MRRLSILAVPVLIGFSSGAYAHPKLLSATPAQNATVAAPARIELHFSERLIPQFSGADVMMTAHGGTAALGEDGRTLVITPRSALRAGRYSVSWHVVSADTHRITGNYAFTVR